MLLVLDASVALAWCYTNEQTPPIMQVRQRVVTSGAIVPAIWRLEIANALRAGVRRERITVVQRNENLNDFLAFPITIDNETNHHAWETIIALSDQYNLTPYDAAYLELAQRLNLPLATLDAPLAAAAKAAKVKLAL